MHVGVELMILPVKVKVKVKVKVEVAVTKELERQCFQTDFFVLFE